MISSIRGKIIKKNLAKSSLIVEAFGVGYGIAVPARTIATVKDSEDIFLFTHEHIREDARDLYGFETENELDFFLKLLNVSGIGPKMGMNFISLGNIEEIKKAIDGGKLEILTSFKGVGKKIAQKIILELKGKLADDEIAPEDEIFGALKSLGYTPQEAKEAIKLVPSSVLSAEARLREALRHLAR
jgi:Holliday junction DNA helicase RuvA